MVKNKKRVYKCGNLKLRAGKSLVPLPESTALFLRARESFRQRKLKQSEESEKRIADLRTQLWDHGFIFVRGCLPEEKVVQARETFLQALKDNPVPDSSDSSRTVDVQSGEDVGQKSEEQREEKFRTLFQDPSFCEKTFDAPELREFFRILFDEHLLATRPDCTWLRAKAPSSTTSEHTDYEFFRKNTNLFSTHSPMKLINENQLNCGYTSSSVSKDPDSIRCSLCHSYLGTDERKEINKEKLKGCEVHCCVCANMDDFPFWTCWVAMSPISSWEDGPLALVPYTHSGPSTQGYTQVKGEVPLRLRKRIKDLTWQAPETMAPGDVILFNIKLLHAALRNETKATRTSFDTRLFGKQQGQLEWVK